MTPLSIWQTGHASHPGRKHRSRGAECQDHSCILRMPQIAPDTLVATIADGVGSASHAGTAAQAAAKHAARRAAQNLWLRRDNLRPHHLETILNDAVLSARHALEYAADLLELPLVLQSRLPLVA